MENERTIGQVVATLILIGGPCVFALLKPEPVWRLRFLFSSWAYRGGEPPEPSAGGLAAVRLVAFVILAMVVGGLLQSGGAPGGARQLEDPTTSTMAGAPGGLECEPTERVVTVQSEYATNAEGAVDLEEAAPGPDEAVARYRAARFPGLRGPPEKRDGNEFVFRDSTGRASLVILAASAPEGWYVSLHHACGRFETFAKTPR